MSLNATHSSSHLQPFSIYSFDLFCFTYEPGVWVFNTFIIANILLLLPLCILILRHGFQQHFSSSPTTMTHSDSFTYHLVVMELTHIFGCIICVCGLYESHYLLLVIWMNLFCIVYYGESFFHLLTCLEHYLAVVHPIVYMSLKKERWIRIRNMVIACIWLSCLGMTSLLMSGSSYIIVDLCLSCASVIFISFCSLSVLCVLTHPGPGDQGRERVRVGQAKQRALCTIMAILGVLLLRCVYLLVFTVEAMRNGGINVCVLSLTMVWVNLPASLILPLLYAQRAGMLACLRKNKQ